MSGWENTPPRDMLDPEAVVEHIIRGEYPLHPADIVVTCAAGAVSVCVLLTGNLTAIVVFALAAGFTFKVLETRVQQRLANPPDSLTSATNTIHNFINHSDLRKRVNSGMDKIKAKTGEVAAKLTDDGESQNTDSSSKKK